MMDLSFFLDGTIYIYLYIYISIYIYIYIEVFGFKNRIYFKQNDVYNESTSHQTCLY
jgi:hypothetical protein